MKDKALLFASNFLCIVVLLGLSGQSNADGNFAVRTGSTFLPVPADPYKSPRLQIIELPDFPGAAAIWGATGRDSRGHIWAGVSADGGEHSGHLIEYEPESGKIIDRGDVLTNLKSAGLYRMGERQVKIHSRIVPGDDGYLYFSSTDEDGEKDDGSSMPRWGSHLWRLLPGDNQWEHLYSVPEGLTAVAGGGRWIYALGLWNHVLYQYDTQNGALKKVTVGSRGGHMSRNLIADPRGHVFVPRLQDTGVTLVEFNSKLEEIAATPLDNYLGSGKPRKYHGIVGMVYLADGSMVIATHLGYLYRISPQDSYPSLVEALGPFDTLSPDYSPSLFTYAGERYIVGLVRHKNLGKGKTRQHVWIVYDLESRRGMRVDFPLQVKGGFFGSITRDQAGRFYVGGRYQNSNGKMEPLLLQIDTGD